MGDAQIHDFNPGITPRGLFWTVFAPCESVQFDLKAGTASLHVHPMVMQDYFTLENALVGGGAPPTRAVVSFKVVWKTMGEKLRFDNAAQQFRGKFRLASALGKQVLAEVASIVTPDTILAWHRKLVARSSMAPSSGKEQVDPRSTQNGRPW
jgi:hypothetical protein